MRRLYLSPSGVERVPTPDENSHFGIARAELGPDWRGDVDDAYGEMWKRGWVRVVDYGDKVYAEKYDANGPVPFLSLSSPQRRWLEDQRLGGKQIFWNDQLFVESREGQRGQALEIVERLRKK